MLDKIKEALDMDEWKHTWHNKLETSEDMNKAVAALRGKLERRLHDIELIRGALSNAKIRANYLLELEKEQAEAELLDTQSPVTEE